ncbi:MAG TPA: DnaJ domain-containing protein [Rhodocyclaceae bacterium]|nr:DnaJ domain-containing protein [Rhodocyclaceae bacterium]HNM81608.1 DnaJ domain-containing protein [Rhodocyclaceae bacterium]
MLSESHYETLGVPKNASLHEIKRAYRKLAMKWHPDRNLNETQEAEQRFKRIAEAYATLSDEYKRRYYDETEPARATRRHESQQTSSAVPVPGKDAYAKIVISIAQALQGFIVEATYRTDEYCSECQGDGEVIPGYRCPNCNGTGQKAYSDGSNRCRKCSGSGRHAYSRCQTCKGKKTLQKKHALRVKLPAGVYDGCVFSISGKGGTGLFGGKDGALNLEVKIATRGKLRVENNDVIIPLVIDCFTALLGGAITANSALGRMNIDIPPLTRAGTRIVSEIPGFREKNSTRWGVVYAEIAIDLPKSLKSVPPELESILRALKS